MSKPKSVVTEYSGYLGSFAVYSCIPISELTPWAPSPLGNCIDIRDRNIPVVAMVLWEEVDRKWFDLTFRYGHWGLSKYHWFMPFFKVILLWILSQWIQKWGLLMRKPGSFEQVPGGVQGVSDSFHLNYSNLYESHNPNECFNLFS